MRMMKSAICCTCLMSLVSIERCRASEKTEKAEKSKKITVDKSKFSDIYPAVWFSPSTGEISPLKERSEIPPEKQYEIWIEPNNPEFVINLNKKPLGVGFVLLGKGRKIFDHPMIPKKLKLNRKLTRLMKEEDGSKNLVFYCQAKSSRCLIMVTEMDKKKEVISFEWRILKDK